MKVGPEGLADGLHVGGAGRRVKDDSEVFGSWADGGAIYRDGRPGEETSLPRMNTWESES